MRSDIFQVLKAVLCAAIISLAFVLLFTLVIRLFSLPMECVKPTNQVFKILSIVGGILIFLRGDKGLIKGGICGVAAIVITYLLYGAISGSLSFSPLFFVEILLGLIAGGIAGIIAVNLKSQK